MHTEDASAIVGEQYSARSTDPHTIQYKAKTENCPSSVHAVVFLGTSIVTSTYLLRSTLTPQTFISDQRRSDLDQSAIANRERKPLAIDGLSRDNSP